jgi:L-fucose isomerase-like protein
MNNGFTVKLGVVPIKRGPGFTSTENALIAKNDTIAALRTLDHPVELVTLDDIVPDGLAHSPHQLPAVTAHLLANEVDAVFLLHTDFGSEEVAAKVARAVNKPVLLWGRRDDAPSEQGRRIRDTQCGLFATSKVLQRMKIPFTYIENCLPSEEVFLRGAENFCRAAAIVKTLRTTPNGGMKILKIGERPDSFYSVMGDEGELLRQFNIEVLPLSVSRLVNQVKARKENPSPVLTDYVADLKSRMAWETFGEDKLTTLAAIVQFVIDEMKAKGAAAASIECWSGLSQFFSFVPCQVIGECTALGYPIACEGDIPGAVSLALLCAADYNRSPAFFADLTVRHPENPNAELLWHCGPFPRALAKEGENPSLDEGGRGQWQLKDGDLTIARFDSRDNDFYLFAGNAKTTDGPLSTGTYVWMETDNWPAWERKFIEGPYIHHVPAVYGHYADALAEACKYIPGLTADRV